MHSTVDLIFALEQYHRLDLHKFKNNKGQPANKQYVVVDVPIKKQLMIAAKKWIVSEELCLYPTGSTQLETSPSTSESKNVGGAIAAASKFTLLGTYSKRALQKYRFLSSAVNEKDLEFTGRPPQFSIAEPTWLKGILRAILFMFYRNFNKQFLVKELTLILTWKTTEVLGMCV
ncbi:unnamed protein product [Schistosoma mattheei]|uniref:Uncharacterized protein n=1 Tax=Schistosoma mattheei TaxID=31246 RepID=A0A183PPI5_9TREM|nr:unnamed protein product [Schistosoma mattheei]